ncbi:MAG: hypothetical protein K2W97_08120 [Chthoniobacterales bacterium]|nr:hypothetical protein [Chthoniobacterales bacterium]
MIPPISRSLKIGSLCVATAAISFTTWKHQGLHGSQKRVAVHQDVSKNFLGQPRQVARTTVLAPVHLPAPLNKLSEEELREFPGATVVEASETVGPKPGQKIHFRLLKTHFKYPLIRTKEVVDTAKNSVVGALALMMAQFPMESYQELIAGLLAATDKIPALEGKTISGGLLNVAKQWKKREEWSVRLMTQVIQKLEEALLMLVIS